MELRTASILLALLLLASTASAQFGEYSGFLYFNQTPNTTQSLRWTIINGYNTSVEFFIDRGSLQSSTNSLIVPNITYYPMNGTINPNSAYIIQVSVYLPKNISLNQSWQALPTAFASPVNSSNSSGGVTLRLGTAKRVFVNSFPSTTTSSTSSSTSSTTTSVASTTIPKMPNANLPLQKATPNRWILALGLGGVVLFAAGYAFYRIEVKKPKPKKKKVVKEKPEEDEEDKK